MNINHIYIMVFGPTAAGKTFLAIELAKQLNGTIINADSRQIYAQMPIITAMPTVEEFAAVPHKLFDFMTPDTPFSVTTYLELARKSSEEVLATGKTPFFVGGTGFYLKALKEGLSPIPPVPEKIMNELLVTLENEGIGALHEKLAKLDPELACRLPPQDTQRILRGLGVYQATGKKLSYYQELPKEDALPHRFFSIAICPPRNILYERIHLRFEQMLKDGLLEEVEKLREKNYKITSQSLTSLGIKPYYDYFAGKCDLEDAHQQTLQQMRNYAKRQTTWLRHQYNADIILESATEIEKASLAFEKWKDSHT